MLRWRLKATFGQGSNKPGCPNLVVEWNYTASKTQIFYQSVVNLFLR